MSDLNEPDSRGGTDVLERTDEAQKTDLPWQVMLWNDPVNTTEYVTLTLVRVLEVDKVTAERFMVAAHTDGKTAVRSGAKDECERIATALMAASLWATVSKAGA